jgi:hypothetical protein
MSIINLQEPAVRGKEAYDVAAKIRADHFQGRPSNGVTINLAPCAKNLFSSPGHARRFEKAVEKHLHAE